MVVDAEFLKKEILDKYGTPNGPNCAECMFLYAVKTLNVSVPDSMMKIATPFGGGMGRCEDACGTLIGGVIVIGLKYGRVSLDGDKLKPYAVAKNFYRWFKNEFGATDCLTLNYSDFMSEDHKNRCGGNFIAKSIEYLDGLFAKVDSGEWRPEI